MKKNYFSKYEEFKKINEEKIKKSPVAAENVKKGKSYFMPAYLTNAHADAEDDEMIKVKVISKTESEDGGYDMILQLQGGEKEEHYYTGVEEDFYSDEPVNEAIKIEPRHFQRDLKKFEKVKMNLPLYVDEIKLTEDTRNEKMTLSLSLSNGFIVDYQMEKETVGKAIIPKITCYIQGHKSNNDHSINVPVAFDKNAEYSAEFLIEKAYSHVFKIESQLEIVMLNDRK